MNWRWIVTTLSLTRARVSLTGSPLVRLLSMRLVILVVQLLIISFLTFALLKLTPGNPVLTLLGNQPTTPQAIAALTHRYHLDQPFLVQYLIWLKGALHFDFGTSIQSGQPVLDMITSRLPVTLFLGCYAFVIAIIGGLALGITGALKRGSGTDRFIVGLSTLGLSAPAFVSGLLVLYVLSLKLGWFPASGAGSGFADRLWHLTLPALTLAASTSALVLRLTRSSMSVVLSQDYITFARARGVRQRRVIAKYGLSNAMGPIVTAVGLVLAFVLTGAVIIETVYDLPGIGSLLVESVQSQDIPVVQGLTALTCGTVIVINIGVDVAYLLIDPRLRHSGGLR
jgi:peptide/nickel transport system permease protein